MFTVYSGGRPITAFRDENDADMFCREWAIAGRSDLYYIASEA